MYNVISFQGQQVTLTMPRSILRKQEDDYSTRVTSTLETNGTMQYSTGDKHRIGDCKKGKYMKLIILAIGYQGMKTT